jgi:hypothetical protein
MLRLPLKTAILASGKTQREIAHETRIPETRLSEIVRGWAEPRDAERDALARALNQDSGSLFTV